MPIYQPKPTTPSQRGMVKVLSPYLHKGDPFYPLLRAQVSGSGRNNQGRITTRHKGGQQKHLYRLMDFKRNKIGVPAKVVRFEYDPNRSAHIALLSYADGDWRYIIMPKHISVGDTLLNSPDASIKPGNTLPLKNIPVGTTVHCIEIKPGKGAQLARAAGTSAQILGKYGSHAQLRLRSGTLYKVHLSCAATIGSVGHDEHSLRKYGKAGAKRWIGIRPTVRGVAMNPIDHPHGGGEGKTASGRHPVSPWGQLAKGYKTVKK
jgi:large subunit ribosomal protein L2